MSYQIRAARWTERGLVAEVIADALHPTPLGAWLIPDQEQRGAVLAAVVDIWVEHAMFYGDIHLTDDFAAASVCFHRYRPLPPPADYTDRLAKTAGPHADRFAALDDLIASAQPSEAHYHLAYLAVRPAHQHTGRGSALMAHLRNRLDRIELSSWTATLPDGQHLLASNGYQPYQAITPTNSVTLRTMSRSPRRDMAPVSALTA